MAILFDPDADAVGEEESNLGDFLDGPDGSPPEGIHTLYDFGRMKRPPSFQRALDVGAFLLASEFLAKSLMAKSSTR